MIKTTRCSNRACREENSFTLNRCQDYLNLAAARHKPNKTLGKIARIRAHIKAYLT